jgi:hypothetical protein
MISQGIFNMAVDFALDMTAQGLGIYESSYR